MKVVKVILVIIGILLVLFGIIWFLQGVNVLPGSVMSGKTLWVVNGIIAFAVGVIIVIAAGRKKAKK